MHTTNYVDTFIEVAEDCPVAVAQEPPHTAAPGIARLQYEMLADHPYELTSDDVVFGVHARRRAIPEDQLAEARMEFFAKGQPCLRSSPLAKRYGWGVHSDEAGRVALVPLGSPDYQRVRDAAGAVTIAMRSSRRS